MQELKKLVHTILTQQPHLKGVDVILIITLICKFGLPLLNAVCPVIVGKDPEQVLKDLENLVEEGADRELQDSTYMPTGDE